MATTVSQLSACVDCVQYVAGIDAHERGEEYPRATVDGIAECDAMNWQLVNGGCSIDADDEWFAASPCEICGSTLAGNRRYVTALETR